MAIQSGPFQATILTGEDARRFKKHLDEPQSPKAKEIIDRGFDMVRNGDTKFKVDANSMDK